MASKSSYSAPSAFDGSQARSSANRTAGRIARSRYKNSAVKKALASKGPKKTIVKGNRSAIHTLAKQVRLLQLQKFGTKNSQLQSMKLSGGLALTRPTLTTPLAFCVSNFYDGTAFYQGSVVAGIPIITGAGQMKKQTFDIDLEDEYQWNEKNNQAVVNPNQYLPVYTKLKFTLTGQMNAGQLTPLRYRFTLFSTKRSHIPSKITNASMPSTLGAYWHMCDDDTTTRNAFTKNLHKVYQDKFLTILPSPGANSVQKVYRTIEMPFSFAGTKPYIPEITTTPGNQIFWTNVPQDEIIWCLVSCNSVAASGVDIMFQRQIVWRDIKGQQNPFSAQPGPS